MKIFFVIFSIFICLVLCQPSSNPDGTPYFSIASVNKLQLNSTITSRLTNVTQFYWVRFPDNVRMVKYVLNNTDTSCNNYVFAYLNEKTPSQNDGIGFPCLDGDNTEFCYGNYLSLQAFQGAANPAIISIFPGTWHYITMKLGGTGELACNFTLSLTSFFECPTGSFPAANDSTGAFCLSSQTPITTSGQTNYGTLTSYSQVDVYSMTMPANITRAWIQGTSAASSVYFMVTPNYAGAGIYSPDSQYQNYGTYDNATNLYSYHLELDPLPSANFTYYWTVVADPEAAVPVNYSISFYWSDCGPSHSGHGYLNGVTNTFSIPDCNIPLAYNNINPNVSQTYVFNLPKYNSTVDAGYAMMNGYMAVPLGTVGFVNISCDRNYSGSFVTISKDAFATCLDYWEYITCVPPYYYLLLSQDLWPGGYFSIAACNHNSINASTITLHVTGAAYVASPLPSPGSTSTSGHESGASVIGISYLMIFGVVAFSLQ